MPQWRSDIDTVHNILRNILGDNQLATKCADILDHILPPHSVDTGVWGTSNDLDLDAIDFSMWPADPGNMFGSFVWPEPGEGF